MLTVKRVTEKQMLADQIISVLEQQRLDGYFYLGYPMLSGIDGKIEVDALLVCREYGLVIFDLHITGKYNVNEKLELLDNLYNNMEARLKRYGYLSKGRKLQVPINVVSFAPRLKVGEGEEICVSEEELRDYLEKLNWDESPEYYEKLLEALEISSPIKQCVHWKNMKIIYDSKTRNELEEINKSNLSLTEVTEKLLKGKIKKEDLDEKILQGLKEVLFQ